jgi:hypothetical protein
VELGVALSHTLPAVVPKPERGGASWPSWVVLLSGAPPHERNGIVRSLQLAAGLLKITLRVEFDADARFAVVSRGLRQRPPTGLLIWEQRVGNAQRFAKLYTSARPSGVVDFFSPERPDDPRSLIGDLLVHLQLLTEAWQRPKEQISWTEVKIRATALQSSSFVLTDRALSQLASSPYPDPERMLSHLERLAKLAAEFGTGRGRLGARLEDAGRLLGLDIALFDSSLNAPNIVVEGSVLSVRAEPHVKVDDHKSPDKCGRIYFAVDSDNYRFIVDHVGVHDYGYR